MRLDNVLAAQQEFEDPETVREFARHAGLGLSGYDACDLAAGNLTLIFALSAWTRSSGMGTLGACSSLLRLRAAILEASGLDPVSEPVPLLSGDAPCALISLSIYMHGLICRASVHSGHSRAEIVDADLGELR